MDQVRRFEADFIRFVESSHPGILNTIREKKALSDELKTELKQVVNDFKATWQERAFNPQPDPPSDPTKAAVATTTNA